MHFLERIHKNENQEYRKEDLSSLLIHFNFFLHMVLSRMYDTEEKHFYTNLLPKWKSSHVDAGKTLEQFSVLNLFRIMFLNLELPIDYQNEWKPLFSSKVNGESFSRSGKLHKKYFLQLFRFNNFLSHDLKFILILIFFLDKFFFSFFF